MEGADESVGQPKAGRFALPLGSFGQESCVGQDESGRGSLRVRSPPRRRSVRRPVPNPPPSPAAAGTKAPAGGRCRTRSRIGVCVMRLDADHVRVLPLGQAGAEVGDGHREIVGLDVATAEDGVGRLVVDAIGTVLPGVSWQRCRTHHARNGTNWPLPRGAPHPELCGSQRAHRAADEVCHGERVWSNRRTVTRRRDPFQEGPICGQRTSVKSLRSTSASARASASCVVVRPTQKIPARLAARMPAGASSNTIA